MKPIIKKFIIKGLFGKKDVSLSFSSNARIYVGENGLGKTTILNALYYVLSLNFEKLVDINFISIELHFSNEKIFFSKDDLIKHLEFSSDRHNLFAHVQSQIKTDSMEELQKIINMGNLSEDEKIRMLIKFYNKNGIRLPLSINSRKYIDITERILGFPVSKFAEIKEIIENNIKSKILYFPTYRRIEEELKNLGISAKAKKRTSYFSDTYIESLDRDESDENFELNDASLIQFGMTDVEKRIKNLTQAISRSSVSGFSKLTGDMLVQLLDERKEFSGFDSINVEDVKIILNRVGGDFSRKNKEKIIELVATKEIFKTPNSYLIYFLDRLLAIYKSQKAYDTAIKNFKDVCNGYLNEKHYEYDESTVDLKIIREQSDEVVPLAKLSSGEKQIVSLFSKIYLDPDESFIVLFDEPELSLSIFWQKKLLPDILKSERCKFLLAVTHSPFIFENDLQENAIGLKSCFKERRMV